MSDLRMSDRAVQALRSQFGSLLSGVQEDYTSPLVPREWRADKDAFRARCAEEVYGRCSLSAVDPRLRAVEDSKRLVHGTFSRWAGFSRPALGENLETKIRKYVRPRPQVKVNPVLWSRAIEAVLSLCLGSRYRKLRPLSLAQAAASSFPGNTGLGFPEMSSSRDKDAVFRVFKISEDIENSDFDPFWITQLPAVLGTRAVSQGPYLPAKYRAICQVARALNNHNKRVQAVLQPVLRDDCGDVFSAWKSREAVNRAMTRWLAPGTRNRARFFSLDFKGFDASVPFEVIDASYRVIEGCFTRESRALIRFNREAFKRMGILCPGFYLPGCDRTGGVPSGSVDTNMIDSISNLLVLHYAGLALKAPVVRIMVQGDDACLEMRGNPSLSDLAGMLFESFGMSLSMDKTTYDIGQISFLQNLHLSSYLKRGLCVGMRPIMHLINAMWSYERIDGDDWERLYDSIRWAQQVSEGDDHPSANALYDWLAGSDPVMAEVVHCVRNDDGVRLQRAVAAVAKKRSSLSWGISLHSFKRSPFVSYLLGERSQ